MILLELTTATLLTRYPAACTATVAGEVKFVPVMVTVTLAPRDAALGDSEVKRWLDRHRLIHGEGLRALLPAAVAIP